MPLSARLCLLVTLLFSALLAQSNPVPEGVSAHPTITFILSPANKPPFWYQRGGKARGLVPELLRSIAKQQQFHLQMLQVPRKRGIELIRENPHFLMGLAREWVPDPENFQFSRPVATTRDVLISHKSAPVALQQQVEELNGELLGTHFGYHYPTLEPLFEVKQLIRSDSHSEQALLERLRRKRIKVAVMTEAVARWYLSRYGWQEELYIDRIPVASAQLRLMAHVSEQELIKRINQALVERESNGALQALQKKFFSPQPHTEKLVHAGTQPIPALP